jgi:hypothetical protein
LSCSQLGALLATLVIGLLCTVQLTNALFSQQPAKLDAINTGYRLLCNPATP